MISTTMEMQIYFTIKCFIMFLEIYLKQRLM